MSIDEWTQGFAAACAITIRNHDEVTIVAETYLCNFKTECQLRKAGVEEYDIEVLRPVIKEAKRRINNRRKICKNYLK